MSEMNKALNLNAEISLQAVFTAANCPALFRRTLSGALTWQQRNETTIQRVLRTPTLAPQWVAALLAWGAYVVCEGEKQLLSDFMLGRGTGRRLEALHVMVDNGGRTWGESHVARTPADPPIVAAVAVVDWKGGIVQQARIALTGVGNIPSQAGGWLSPVQLIAADGLLGGALDDDQIEGLVASLRQAVEPPDTFLGGAEYRREMTALLARRALQVCRDEN